MMIKEVMEKTRLSRKAVYYYEEQGLISPGKNQENLYREYSKEDVQKLIIISLLRDLDYSVEEIKGMMSSNEFLDQYLGCHIKELKDQSRMIDAKIKVLEKISQRHSRDTSLELQDLLKGVTQFINSGENSENYYYNQLVKDFPGPYGQTLALFFGPLLKGPFNKEKKYAWYELLLLLDDLEPRDFPPLFIDLYKHINDDNIEDLRKKSQAFWDQSFQLTQNTEQLEQIFQQRQKTLEQSSKSPKEFQSKLGRLTQNIMNQGKTKFAKVMKCFEEFSPAYKTHRETLGNLVKKYSPREE